MKKILLTIAVFYSTTGIAQLKTMRTIPLTTNNINLFDAVPGYKKAPIAFVPITPGADAAKKGYKADSMYTWTDPAGKTHRATGAQILQQVNEVEKSLCERGHSFRHKNTFDGLKATIPKDMLMNGIINQPSNFLSKKTGNNFPSKFNRFNNNLNIGGTIYPYLGQLQKSAEFPGSVQDVERLTRLNNDATTLSFPLILAAASATISKAAGCTIEIYNNAAKTGLPIFIVPLNLNKPDCSIPWTNQVVNNSENIPPVTNGTWLYNYTVRFTNVGNKIPNATPQHNYYYLDFKFTGTDGKPLLMSLQNQVVVDNSLAPPINISVFREKAIKAFDFEVTDPVKHCFGFYAKSNGFIAKSSSEPFGFYGQNKKSAFNANINIGARYYNFGHLLNSNAPLTKDLEILGFDFSAVQNYNRPDRLLQIRVPGSGGEKNLLQHPNTKFQLRILGKTINTYEDGISEMVFNERFFIGPVPCIATVMLTGNAGVKANGVYTENTCDMSGKIEPYAALSVTGSGGVDALIAYAKVEVNVTLLKVGLPIEFNIDNPANATVQSSIDVSGLSGDVNFKAGFCIPIPFFDDICKDFTIQIFHWDGFNQKYTIDNAGVQ